MTFPSDPVAAVTHPDPYPYYTDLVARNPLYHDSGLGLWVASSDAMVTTVLTSDLCRVRPVDEPVPAALLGSPAGEIFRHLVRMADGERHGPVKQAVSATLRTVDPVQVAVESRRWASVLLEAASGPNQLPGFSFALPVHVLGSLLGIPREMLREVSIWTGDFAGCIAPGATPEQTELGKEAAANLRELIRPLITGDSTGVEGLLCRLQTHAARHGLDDIEMVVANAIGFLFQSYDATAALIGNTMLALASRPDVRAAVNADPGLLDQVILEVLRHDAPVQNTRRFVAGDGIVAGQEMMAGEAILVVLAAANRDPSANPRPDEFDLNRKNRRIFSFGAGVHACPGDVIAVTIARAGVEGLMSAGLVPASRPETVTYRRSANARIPLWVDQTER